MRIRVVENSLPDLVRDMNRIGRTAKPGMARVVRKNAEAGDRLARRIAQEKAGPHGENYYKRVTAEAITPLSWEYGPEGIPKTDFVGVSGAKGAYMDLAQSCDVIGPKLGADVGKMIDKWFW